MKTLIVTIPAYNEEATIGEVIREVPRDIPGVDRVLVLVFDDGSTDRTGEVARSAGADFVLAHKRNKGLAVTFRDSLDAALQLGADIIVNTDADNHYDQARIPELVTPIISGGADIVVGSRALNDLRQMGFARKWGNRIASSLFCFLYRLPRSTDVSSGFRAYSREAAMRLTVTFNYTYAHETLIVAKDHNLAIVNEVFPARDVTRPSRLMSSLGSHIFRAGSVAILSYAVHRLFLILMVAASILMLGGVAAFLRFLYFVLTSGGAGHIQSLIIGSVLVIVGLQVMLGSFFALALSKNRKLIEDIIYQQRRAMYERQSPVPDRADVASNRASVADEVTRAQEAEAVPTER
ncbi:MAG: glycosyltransferase [Dehalococcoidia bacterium]